MKYRIHGMGMFYTCSCQQKFSFRSKYGISRVTDLISAVVCFSFKPIKVEDKKVLYFDV